MAEKLARAHVRNNIDRTLMQRTVIKAPWIEAP